MAEEKGKKQKKPTALKRDELHNKRRLQNRIFKSQVNTALRRLQDAAKDPAKAKESTPEALNKVYSLVDKGVKKRIYKGNKAGRMKSAAAALVK